MQTSARAMRPRALARSQPAAALRRLSSRPPSQTNNFIEEGRAGPPVGRMAMPKYVTAGRGGRMSRRGHTVAVFGATGFLGMYVVDALGRQGANIVVTTRQDDMSWRHLKVCADYGKLMPSYIHMKDEDTVRATVAGADTVVNLMGKYYETKHYLPSLINCSFRDVNVTAAETVARIAREEDCKHLVHVSCAYASHDSLSENMRTKKEGEARVLEQFPGAVIVRPNLLYGEEDRFLNLYANIVRSMLPYVPVVGGGEARVRPTFVGDVGQGIAQAALNFQTAGQEFNLSAAHEYSQRELFEFVMEQTGRADREMVDLPLRVAELIGRATDKLPAPYWTHDTMKMLVEDCPGPSGAEKTFADLGIDDVADFETRAVRFLFRYKQGGHFKDLGPTETDVI